MILFYLSFLKIELSSHRLTLSVGVVTVAATCDLVESPCGLVFN